MQTCPFCQSEFDQAASTDDLCPNCGKSIPAPTKRPATAGGSDPIDQTVDLPQSGGAGGTQGGDSGPQRGAEIEKTVDLDSGSDTATPPIPQNGPSPQIDATVDLDATDPNMTDPQADTANVQKTIDLTDQPPSDDADASVDTAYVTRIWAPSIDENVIATSSLSSASDRTSTTVTSSLVIQRRAMSEHRESQEAKANADYELINLLGKGGMGVVYAARQGSINRTVAVKMLKEDGIDDKKMRGKFLAEAVVTGDLEHPNIVPIYDLGSNEKGALFYSMKRVVGTPWDAVIEDKSLQENLEILMKVADAVAFAHSRGVIHRDLKPENTMLGGFGEVLVMDWGLALTDDNRAGAGMGGSPAYMAPEMATGPMTRIGLGSDIYLLGAILYEVVTGKRPHHAKTVMDCLQQAAHNIIQETDKSGELVNIALKAMAAKSDDRYRTVGELQDAIRDYQGHAESIALSTRAAEDLEEAEASGDYQCYARALFGFEEAVALWDGNDRAETGLSEAKSKYAACALRKGDYDLGASLLDRDLPEHAALYREIEKARIERDARQRRLKTAKRVGVALVAMIFLIITVSFFWIRGERAEALRQKGVAENERGKAEVARDDAEIARDEALAAKQLEETARQQAEQSEAEALAAEKRAVAAKEEAIIAQKKEEYEAYVARIGLADAKIKENSFDRAIELLNECPPHLRRWEWGRLMHLCTQDVRHYDARGPIDSVAYAPDGQHFAAGGWDGVLRIWNLNLNGDGGHAPPNRADTPLFEIPTGGQSVFAVAYSPDGKRIATGTNERGKYINIWDAETGELLQTLEGHKDAVLSVVFSRDGNRLLTGSYDETARLWDLRTGESQPFIGHEWWVWSAQFSPDESRIVTASHDGTARVWSVATGESAAPFRGHNQPVFCAAFSPDGMFVVSGGYDNRLRTWDPEQIKKFDFKSLVSDRQNPPQPHHVLEGHRGAVRAISFSPDGRLIVSGSHDNTIRVWDAASRSHLKTLRGHASNVRACSFSPDGQWVLSGSHDNQAKLWSIDGYQEMKVFRGRVLRGHLDDVLSSAFSPSGDRLLTASRDRTSRVWDFETGDTLLTIREGHEFLASEAIFFPNGRRVVTAAVDNTARIWDLESGTEIHRLDKTGAAAAVALSHDARWIATGSDSTDVKIWDADSGELVQTLAGHRAEVTAIAFSRDNRLILSGDQKGRCKLWDLQTGEPLWTAHSHSRNVIAAAFTPDGKRVLTASLDNTVAQWDVESGTEDLSLILKHPDSVTSMSLSPDGRHVLTTCADGAMRMWDADSARTVRRFSTENEMFSSAAFASDGRRAVTAGAKVRLWDVVDGKELTLPDAAGERRALVEPDSEETSFWSAVFSPDGNFVLTLAGAEAQLWNVETGAANMVLGSHGAVSSASFSPDGERIVTGSWDKTARIWDSHSGRGERKLEGGHRGYINSAVYSPDGRWVLTASNDGTAKIWDAATGEVVRTFDGHEDSVRSAAFSTDGRRIVTASDDRTARIWDASSGEQLHILRGHEWAVVSAHFSADGSRIVTGSEDNTAKLWYAETGKELGAGLAGHTATVRAVAFSPVGERVATASEDNTIKIWDSVTSKEIMTLRGHTEAATTVSFSTDGQFVVSGSRDGTAIVWLTAPWE